jgi:hypothetical protein
MLFTVFTLANVLYFESDKDTSHLSPHASPLLPSASASAAETSDGALKIAALHLHLHRRH